MSSGCPDGREAKILSPPLGGIASLYSCAFSTLMELQGVEAMREDKGLPFLSPSASLSVPSSPEPRYSGLRSRVIKGDYSFRPGLCQAGHGSCLKPGEEVEGGW